MSASVALGFLPGEDGCRSPRETELREVVCIAPAATPLQLLQVAQVRLERQVHLLIELSEVASAVQLSAHAVIEATLPALKEVANLLSAADVRLNDAKRGRT